MRTVAITIVIKMQFTVFCCAITVKLHFRRNLNSSSSVIISTIFEQIFTSIRPRINCKYHDSSKFLLFYMLCSVESYSGCFFSTRVFVLCQNKRFEPHSYTFILRSVLEITHCASDTRLHFNTRRTITGSLSCCKNFCLLYRGSLCINTMLEVAM